jgi:hypothetical protein
MKVYQIDFFKNRKSIVNNVLPLNILETINELSELVGSPEYNRTPEFINKDKYKKKRNDTYEIDNLSISRTIINKKNGIQKEIDSIRILINKLTENQYESISNTIKEKINTISESYSFEECSILADQLFNMLFTNLLFSNIYSILIKDLYNYNFIKNTLQLNLDKFLDIYNENKNKEYKDKLSFDEVSMMNKNFDKNKGMALLFANLLINDVIDKNIIINFINTLINLFFELTNLPDKKMHVDELSEILFILINNSFNIIKNDESWEDIENNIIYISNMKANNRLSISNKSIFKFMDLKDKINI